MIHARPDASATREPEPMAALPSWVGGARGDDVAFASGGALATLHIVLQRAQTPHALLRDRLALRAAEACVALSGRPERAAELRDAVHLLRPGDLPGPAGQVALAWRRAAARPVSLRSLGRALDGPEPERIATWLDAGRGAPVARAAAVLETVLAEAPRAEPEALILADAALAQALGWDHMVPLIAAALRRRDLRETGEDLRLACHRAVTVSATQAIAAAADLARRATRLRAVAPRLRARGAAAAVELFLSRDALAATALTSLRSDRAARRFCDRLVDLGAVRELTGRDTFRLYGV